ncbi:MAG: hypothetical protein A2Y23_14630 [Clostridiales bacterium GWB2_37_7]|nr:MAG: hypothetical protein A2Y23_14630 [Clostridiales bacterium GWB2_37_7]
MGHFGIVSEVKFRTDNMLVAKEASIMKVGYIRVSTREQNTARQEVLLKDLVPMSPCPYVKNMLYYY